MFTARFDESAGPYSAGATPFVVVRNAAGQVVAQRSAASGRAIVSLPRGRYAVGAYWRPCEGGCDAEDLPLDRCAKRVSIHTAARGASETVSFAAVFKGGETCSLRVSSDWPPQAVISTPRHLAQGRPRALLPALSEDVHARRRRSRAPSGASPYARAPAVTIDLKVPTRRLELTGICGSGPLSHSKAGRRWYFKVPRETAASIGTCHDIKLTITYAGPGVRRGVRAVFGFDLRLAG